jgi:tetrahydromethanopterin S-methyltransferase subunit H
VLEHQKHILNRDLEAEEVVVVDQKNLAVEGEAEVGEQRW